MTRARSRQLSLDGLFVAAGPGMTLLTLISLASGSVRRMGLEPVIGSDPEATGEAPFGQPVAAR